VQVTLSTQGCGGSGSDDGGPTTPSPTCATIPTTGTLTVTSTGGNSGVTLNAGVWNFLPAGIGTDSIGNGDN
jgi:hypothetical protein